MDPVVAARKARFLLTFGMQVASTLAVVGNSPVTAATLESNAGDKQCRTLKQIVGGRLVQKLLRLVNDTENSCSMHAQKETKS